MTTYVFGNRGESWRYMRPQDFLPFTRRYSRKAFNRFLRQTHPEHHTKKVWHNIGRVYTRQGLIHITEFGWVSPLLAERYYELERKRYRP